MNISEANATMTALRYLLDIAGSGGSIDDDRAYTTIEGLRARAEKALHAGVRAAELETAFARFVARRERGAS